MSILRKDPVSSGWVIIAEERGQRPTSFDITKVKKRAGFCPFCVGNEDSTPPEISAYREPGSRKDGPGWRVRTIPNKFAALGIEGNLNRRGVGMYDMMNGIGAHEVIIETPEHNANMALYSPQKMHEIITMYHERSADLMNDKRFKYIQIFRNYGHSAGASLDHPHTQVIALPITPRWVKEELSCAKEHYDLKERCLFCDIINQEIDSQSRLIFENDEFISFAPFASKFPFETWIIPKRHCSDFKMISDTEIEQLAIAMPKTLLAISRALSDPPYNLILHSAPQLPPDRPGVETIVHDYHWHIEIYPRISKMAGFEWGTGFYINTVLPEKAAEYLREALTEEIKIGTSEPQKQTS
jgi:UDPglucose--hexose-1-phosphate uridylyltransferase